MCVCVCEGVRGRDVLPWSIFQGRGSRPSVQTELAPHDLDTWPGERERTGEGLMGSSSQMDAVWFILK